MFRKPLSFTLTSLFLISLAFITGTLVINLSSCGGGDDLKATTTASVDLQGDQGWEDEDIKTGIGGFSYNTLAVFDQKVKEIPGKDYLQNVQEWV